MKKIIKIFDLDDTILKTVDFSNFVGAKHNDIIDIENHYSSYFKCVQNFFKNSFSKEVSFKRLGDFVIAIDSLTLLEIKAIDLNCFNEEKILEIKDRKITMRIEEKEGKVVIRPFRGFYDTAETFGVEINEEIFKEYNNSENKMILTGRNEKLRSDLEKHLNKTGVEYPNFGLMLYSGNSGIKKWKADIICKSIEENNWNEVYYFEDREDWLYNTEKIVKEKFSNVIFVPIEVKNIKEKRSF